MQRPLKEHIAYLQGRIESMKEKLANAAVSAAEREMLRIDLGIAERALVYFEKAFELEQRILE